MRPIEIDGLRLTPAPYTDSDVLILANATGNTDPVKHLDCEKVAATLLRTIFPDMPPEWTAGDRLRPPLYRSTLAVLMTRLQEGLLTDEDYQGTLEPLRLLPLGQKNIAAIDALQSSHPAAQGYGARSQNHRPPKKKNRYQ